MTEMVVRKMKNFLSGTFVFRVNKEVTSFLEEWVGVETVMVENGEEPDH